MAKSSRPRATTPSKRGGEQRTHDPSVVIQAPRVSPPVVTGPSVRAVATFERAMASLHRHRYRAALELFEELQDQFSDEGALVDRARVYAALCRRELARPEAGAPATVEERLTAATAALNDGDDRRAEELVALALDETPGDVLGHYLLAVIHARRGATAAALGALRRAIAASPDVRVQARLDADFASLRGDDRFEHLVTDSPAQSGTRRRM